MSEIKGVRKDTAVCKDGFACYGAVGMHLLRVVYLPRLQMPVDKIVSAKFGNRVAVLDGAR